MDVRRSPGWRSSAGPETPGPPAGAQLQGEQEGIIVALIESYSPDQLGLAGSLWTRETVGVLIKMRLGLAPSVGTLGSDPQKPADRAYEQDPTAVGHWLQVEYPEARSYMPGRLSYQFAEIRP